MKQGKNNLNNKIKNYFIFNFFFRVKKFEKELGNTLPKDYREFLLGYNGGYSKQSNLIIGTNNKL